MAPRAPLDERFNRSYRILEDGCWLWTGSLTNGGYGVITARKGVSVVAHRYSYARQYGAILPGHHVRHLCVRKNCVNPRHLVAMPTRCMQLLDVPYPRIKDRERADRVLSWLALKFPPFMAEIAAMKLRLESYGRRRCGWKIDDFDQSGLIEVVAQETHF